MSEHKHKNRSYLILSIVLFIIVILQGIYIGVNYKHHGSEQTSSSRNMPVFSDSDRWDPFAEMQKMRQNMDRIMEQAFSGHDDMDAFMDDFSFAPAIDIREEQSGYIIRVDVPELKESSVNVSIEKNILTIQGERQSKSDSHTHHGMYSSEMFSGKFTRSVILDRDVQAEKMTSEYKDGVLVIKIPFK